MRSYIRFEASGALPRTRAFLNGLIEKRIYRVLDEYGDRGTKELQAQTPVRTGVTAAAWRYEVHINRSYVTLEWYNSSMADDGKTPVVILLMYGHGTGTGGYVAPNDFVTPTMQQIFKDAIDAVWNEVKAL